MKSEQPAICHLLDLGRHSIRLIFDNAALADRARERLYVVPVRPEPGFGEITYECDESVADLIPQACGENAVVIDHKILGPTRSVLNLKVFNEFCVSIVREGSRVLVRYPSRAPLTYLLDDVLQAAVQPFLEDIGGFILHGACLVKDGAALALMGSSGSGKSTTAFNLVRAGYHCYADDAIVVTREGAELYAWPFSREMSIRPLSRQLMETHGASFSGYRQEGKKYYFQQPDLPTSVGVPLRCACLIEVGGESATRAQRLGDEQFLGRLLQDQRYFSFVNRENHDRYAQVVAKCVPQALSVRLGHDLDAQARFFDSVFDPDAAMSDVDIPDEVSGRAAKLAQLRNAWRSPGAEPLVELVPMLGDSDLMIFKNALSFFQNFPLAQMAPQVVENVVSEQGGFGLTNEAYQWLRMSEWREGCRRLIQSTCREAYDQYAAGWFKSAPILYAFLPTLVAPDSAERRALEKAWRRSREVARERDGPGLAPVIVLTDREVSVAPAQPATTGRQYVCISSKAPDTWDIVIERLASSTANRRIVVAPVFADGPTDFGALVTFVRVAVSLGLEPQFARGISLRRLGGNEAAYLLERGVFSDLGDASGIDEIADIIDANRAGEPGDGNGRLRHAN